MSGVFGPGAYVLHPISTQRFITRRVFAGAPGLPTIPAAVSVTSKRIAPAMRISSLIFNSSTSSLPDCASWVSSPVRERNRHSVIIEDSS